MSRSFFVKANAGEFRGAAHDLGVSRFFYTNCPKLSKIIAGMPRVSTICANYTVPAKTCQSIYFHELCKKYLTSSAYYCIIGAAAPKDQLIRKNLHLTRKKDLTIIAVALILAQATLLYIVVVLLLARGRQKFLSRGCAAPPDVLGARRVPRGTKAVTRPCLELCAMGHR